MDPKLAQQLQQTWTAQQQGSIPGMFKWAAPPPPQASAPTPAAKEPRGHAWGWHRRQNQMAHRGFRDAAQRTMGSPPAAPGVSSRISPGTVPPPNSAQLGQGLSTAYNQWKKP